MGKTPITAAIEVLEGKLKKTIGVNTNYEHGFNDGIQNAITLLQEFIGIEKESHIDFAKQYKSHTNEVDVPDSPRTFFNKKFITE